MSPPKLRRTLASLVLAFLFMIVPLTAMAQATLPGQTSPAEAVSPEEAVTRLLDVLKDDTARAALITQLEAEATAPGEPPAAPVAETLAQRVATATADAAGNVATQLAKVTREFGRLWSLGERVLSDEFASYRLEALMLLMTIVATVAVNIALGLVVSRMALRLMPRVGAGLVARVRAAGLVLVARVSQVALSWLAGYALAALVFSGDGMPSAAQSLYLNAFALFGLGRAVLRVIVSPRADYEPNLSVQAPGAQAVIYGSLRAVMGTVIQGFLFVVPLAQDWLGYLASRSLWTLIATLAALIALIAIRRIARALDLSRGDKATGGARAEEASARVARGAQSVWRRIWPPLAMAYTVYAWFVAVSLPGQVEEIVLLGTAYSLAGLALFLIALRLLRLAPELRAPLPQALTDTLARLGPRADRIVTVLAWGGAICLSVASVLLVFAGWGWIDLQGWLGDPGVRTVLWGLASAALVAFGAAAFWALVASWIDGRLAIDLPGARGTARSRTLLALFRNAFTVAIAIFATMITLSQLGVDIAPLLAGAGVIGLAIGFGSQKLVQDIITGIFIQLENAMNEGDVVGVAGITGAVEKITIRSVRLRTADGAAHIVPFSSVDTVTNLTRDYAFHVAEIGAAYKEKVSDVKAAMQEAFDRLSGEGFEGQILGPLDMQGVIQLGDSAVVVRARIKTMPGKQWGIGRRYTELVKEVMDERGLEIPFPHRQLVFPPGAAPLLPAPDMSEAG